MEKITKANFTCLSSPGDEEQVLNWLTCYPVNENSSRFRGNYSAGYYEVDVLGYDLVWMNETFPRDKFTWFHKFESVFAVPEDMYLFLRLKWTK